MKRLVYSSELVRKWEKLGYKIVALSYWNESPITFHIEKIL